MEISFKLTDIEKIATEFQRYTKPYKIFALHGNLGSGKTTFTKAVCNLLGSVTSPSSPTFSIINEYTTLKNEIIYHIDVYRIKSEVEAVEAGVEDCIYSNNICFVEWPEKIKKILPIEVVHVYFETISAEERKMKINLPR
ncbi:MAG: tRNA (adenosine(37)-N6)-threonylcarbamoyltransferase complex ATPase subunit type 1 TsaE [Ginsengibacter sp.]